MSLSSNGKRKITVAAILVLAILAFLINTFAPDIAGRYQRAHSAHLWRLSLELNSAPAVAHNTTVTSALERSLRGLDEVNSLVVSTSPTRVAAHFYTSSAVNPKDFASTLSAKISALRDAGTLPQFEPTFFYEAFSKVALVGTPLDALRTPQAKTLSSSLEASTAQETQSILSLANTDIVVKLKESANEGTNLDALDLVLQRINTIKGVQKAFARDINVPFLRIDSDPRQILQLGISPASIHKTIKDHLQIEQGVSENILGQSGYVFRKKSSSISELCALAFAVARGGSLLKICDVATVKKEPIRLDVYTVGMSISTLERRLRSQERVQTELNLPNPSIAVLLESDVSAQEIRRDITRILRSTDLGREAEVEVSAVPNRKYNNIVILCVSLAILALVSLKARAKFGHRLLVITILAASLAFWSAATYALDIAATPNMASTPILAATIAYAANRCLELLQDLHGARKAPLAFTLLLFGLTLALIFSRSFVDIGSPEYASSFSGIAGTLGGFFAFVLTPSLSGQSSPSTVHSEIPFHLKPGMISAIAPFVGLLLTTIPTTNFSHSILGVFGFEPGTPLELVHNTSAQIERFAREHNATSVIAGPEHTSIIKLKPSMFALLNTSLISVDEILSSLHPSIPGEASILENSGTHTRNPVVVTSQFAEFSSASNRPKEDEILRFQKWLDTMQQPISQGPNTSASEKNSKQRSFLPMSALVVPEWGRELTRTLSTELGESIVTEVHLPRREPEFLPKIENLVKSLENKPETSFRYFLTDTRTETKALESSARKGFVMLTAIFFLAGILFFGAAERALLTSLTALIIHFTVSGIFNTFAIPHGLNDLASLLAFPSEKTWTSTALLGLWAILLRTADYRRAMNMTLDDALALQFRILRQIRKWGKYPGAVLAIAGFSSSQFALLAAVACSVWLIAGFLLPDWIMIWTNLAEWKNRAVLKLKIHHTTTTFLILCLSLLAWPSKKAHANTDTSILDSTCDGTATIVLPILGRPKGKEPVPQRTYLSERLAQETPCAWVDYELGQDIAKLHENLRSTAAQTKLVSDFAAFVGKKRTSIETTAQSQLKRDGRKNATALRIIGGFYEEFLGSISFTILEFPKNGEPVVTKVSSSEEQQTQTISQIARYLRGENRQLHEEILGETIRLPVYIEPVESLDKHPVSENIAGEIGLFLSSRFLNPMSSNLLERKTFFRVERNSSTSKYTLNVKIRREETRLYASLTVRSKDGEARRSAWIEGDVSRFSEFEEEILSVARKTLSNIEGISDYLFALGWDMWLSKNRSLSKMLGLYFRQNLGNAALSLRLRNGTIPALEDQAKISLTNIGAAFGWQFFDIRWLTGDAGFSTDAGLATASDETSKGMWLSYGGYMQVQSSLRKNFAIVTRAGIEQPQLISAGEKRKDVFQDFYWNALVGIGIIF